MQRMYFIGVTTAGSSIMTLFHEWARALGLDAEIVGIDVPVGGSEAELRGALSTVIDDPEARGALVTTHKVSILRHARDMFDELDEWARLCGEVSCVSKRGEKIVGSAKDPITSWKSFVDIVGEEHFDVHPEAEVLCLGAGGSGTAFTSRLLTVDSPPARITLTNRSPERLELVKGIHGDIGSEVEVRYQQIPDAGVTDRLLEALPPDSIVANATGMGKDRPGSPITDGARFPMHVVAWDFNYRGSLEFLAQARSQARARDLVVEDGWRYFLYGWSEHIGEVFEIPLSVSDFDRLAEIATGLH